MYWTGTGDWGQGFSNSDTSAASSTLHLSYNIKAHDFFLFLQEKVLSIPSDKHTKCKSPIGLAHINGISRVYNSISLDSPAT